MSLLLPTFSAERGLAAVAKHTLVTLVKAFPTAGATAAGATAATGATGATADYDALIVISPNYPSAAAAAAAGTTPATSAPFPAPVEFVKADLDAARVIDAAVGSTEVTVVASEKAFGKRLLFASTGPLSRDYDDVRRYADAADRAIKRAVKAGARRPAITVVPYQSTKSVTDDATHDRYTQHVEVALLGALAASYVPLEARESENEANNFGLKVLELGWLPLEANRVADPQRLVSYVNAVEAGRILARDIGGSDPERAAPPLATEHICGSLKSAANVKCTVIADQSVLAKEYPLLTAVGRASQCVERHRPRVIELEYVPAGEIKETLLLVGKGITYDTGGADLKVGGAMAGMHRDKCGAAAIAGLFRTISLLQPKGVAVIAKLAMVRNSIGADAYVSDEIIRARSGARVRIGNTDAEGRMVMADLLCHMKEIAPSHTNPFLFTIATLTGHAYRAYGPYAAVMDNGPANRANVHGRLFDAGNVWGDPFEVSTLRREDFDFVAPKNAAEDVVQANTQPSVNTPRGHQYPGAFLVVASGLDKHGLDSTQPIAYSHLDIAGAAAMPPLLPTASPLVTLAAAFIAPRL
ncbi:hypothetical protein CAOG_003521 [Capsaspora owczarzaki ATCC 30864]|uniref:Cytosol aminopeptidase domain-containing protein n=2 Tax=Capsaspora owczarzaki (strain ATCC 30864) TaxID=595528 RepID=A0A0D2UC54_CAPO3|nr:hypothetical protein CAOG_003521 [Capsaspora owczarzaki ATCC 30864]